MKEPSQQELPPASLRRTLSAPLLGNAPFAGIPKAGEIAGPTHAGNFRRFFQKQRNDATEANRVHLEAGERSLEIPTRTAASDAPSQPASFSQPELPMAHEPQAQSCRVASGVHTVQEGGTSTSYQDLTSHEVMETAIGGASTPPQTS